MGRYDEPNRRVEKGEMSSQEMAEKFRDSFEEGVIEIKKERGRSRALYQLFSILNSIFGFLTELDR